MQFAFICLISYDERSELFNKETPKWHNSKKVHAEELLLRKLDKQYDAFCCQYGKPKALILYSWIVPCTDCTAKIISTLESSRFVEIPERVVAYTTKGLRVRGCSEATAQEAFSGKNITFYSCKYHTKKTGQLITHIVDNILLN